VADHIDHIVKIAGIDHVGIGSDFDGISSTPTDLPDVGSFPKLTEELLRRGYADDDVRKVLGGNLLRAFRRAAVVGEELRRTTAPGVDRPSAEDLGG
jgi:membrane dipeptidase